MRIGWICEFWSGKNGLELVGITGVTCSAREVVGRNANGGGKMI